MHRALAARLPSVPLSQCRLSCRAQQATVEPAAARHTPVLLQEVLSALQPVRLGVYVDGTLGAGGHASAILSHHPVRATGPELMGELRVLVGIDQDPNSHSLAQVRLLPMQRPGLTMHFMQGNYRPQPPLAPGLGCSQVGDLLRSLPLPSSAAPIGPDSPGGSSSGSSNSGSSGQAMPAGALWGRVDGMLLDLGVSSMQLDMAERGFSFMRDGPLDMRMDPAAALTAEEVGWASLSQMLHSSTGSLLLLTAYLQVVNSWSEAELGRILRTYGEEKLWRQVAHRIVQARQEGPLRSTQQLAQAVGQTRVGGPRGSKGIHPATRTFQAIRIAVNDELGNLERAIPEAISCLASGGRLAVISFHSLEDRVVKKAFARAAGKTSSEDEHLAYGRHKLSYPDALEAGATAQLLTRSPLVPGAAEAQSNPRSRSAKLRVLQRL
ncbi:hypothetical protein QJQ45_000503 [Haematococcus lacustris]|nr:hypothetical protein QJQ45_000503 [Haematococcus lacustris]